jgi:hypothetical protein
MQLPALHVCAVARDIPLLVPVVTAGAGQHLVGPCDSNSGLVPMDSRAHIGVRKHWEHCRLVYGVVLQGHTPWQQGQVPFALLPHSHTCCHIHQDWMPIKYTKTHQPVLLAPLALAQGPTLVDTCVRV